MPAREPEAPERNRRRGARILAAARRWALVVLGLFLVVRGVVELAVVDPRDPASYAADWGGPHYLGVLAAHCGPGSIVAVLFARRWWRRSRSSPE